MGGRPVWLASTSIRNRYGQLIPSSIWRADRRTLDRLERISRRAIQGVGDYTAQRFFRMPITACFHRALTLEEEAGLPDGWKDAPAVDLAGGGIETFWSTVGDPLSVQPCDNPGKEPLPGGAWHPDLYLIIECGDCPSCRARLAVRS